MTEFNALLKTQRLLDSSITKNDDVEMIEEEEGYNMVTCSDIVLTHEPRATFAGPLNHSQQLNSDNESNESPLKKRNYFTETLIGLKQDSIGKSRRS